MEHPTTDADPPGVPSFREALRWWFKLGCISFGGPAGQIALMHDELVERRGWISESRFLHALNYCMLLPGPEAQQLATYIGWTLHGVRGGIAAGVLFVLPSLLLLLLLSWAYVAYRHVPAIDDILGGLRAAVVAIIAMAALRLGGRMLKRPRQWAIAAMALLCLLWLSVPYPLLIALAAVAGVLFLRAPLPARETNAVATDGPGPRYRGLPAVVAGCVVSWCVVFALLPAGVLRDMALFFSKAAFLTFGGAYAVLPYINAAAVTQYGWLTPGQMVDGLALGESTPGPLIMVVAFVGFVGGWQASSGTHPLMLGLAGGLVATFFTFLPSFLLVLAGAPWIAASRTRIHLAAPLAGINAAVIGFIIHLAIAFGQATFMDQGRLDLFHVLLGAIAFLALRSGAAGMITTLLLCALAGLLRGAFAGP